MLAIVEFLIARVAPLEACNVYGGTVLARYGSASDPTRHWYGEGP